VTVVIALLKELSDSTGVECWKHCAPNGASRPNQKLQLQIQLPGADLHAPMGSGLSSASRIRTRRIVAVALRLATPSMLTTLIT